MFDNFRRVTFLLDRSDRLQLPLIGLLMLGSAAFETFSIGLVFPLVQLISAPEIVLSSPTINWAYTFSNLSSPRYFIAACGVAFFVMVVSKSVYNVFVCYYQERLLYRVAAGTSKRLVAHYLHAPWSLYLLRNSADMINTAEVSARDPLTNALRGYLVLTTEGLVTIGVLLVLLWIAPAVTLVTLVSLGGFFLVCQRSIQWRLKRLGKEYSEIIGSRIRFIQQGLGSAKEIKVLGRESRFVEEYAEACNRAARLLKLMAVIQNIPRFLIESLMMGAVALVIIIVVLFQADNSGTATAVLGLFAVGGLRLMPSTSRMLISSAAISVAVGPVAKIYDDLTLVHEEDGKPTGPPVPTLRREIRLENITYCYPLTKTPVLHEFSLVIPKGKSVGLVGPSGAGKSTIVDVILGLLPPKSGRITVDGVDVRGNLRSWQRQIGYVPQVISLIDATLRENVAFGIAPHAIDDNRVRQVLSLSRLERLLEVLPNGLNTPIGERGVRLSGGERQRIGIARALYNDPSILIMDEATSSLDNSTENEISQAIEQLHGERTIITIAHRLSTVRRCDIVFMLKDGQVLDQGSFDELSDRCKEFRHMVQLGELGTAVSVTANSSL